MPGSDYRGDAALQQWLYQRARFKILEHVRRFRLGQSEPTDRGDGPIPSTVADVYLDFVTPSRDVAAAEAVAEIEAALHQRPATTPRRSGTAATVLS